jgi:aminopeptidase N
MLALLLALQGALSISPDTVRPRHHALSHDITIVLNDTSSHILGLVQTTWLLDSSEPIEVPLDSTFRVVRVLTDGEGERRLGRITYALNPGGGVYIPHHRQAGDTLHTSIRYHGIPRDGLIFRTDSSGRRTVFADNWPDRAHYWLPITDHPSEKAPVNLHIEVPPGMAVIANGTRRAVDTLPRGRTIWHFRMSQPIPPYGIVFGAGPLVTTPLPEAACEIKCVPLAVVTYAGDSAWALGGPFRRAGDMVEFFSRFVGPFPYDRLSHVESSTIFGGAENPTAVFYDETAYPSRRLRELTVAHETAHQWFGDAVTERDWHHLWLSEGFATYFAALWLQHAEGDSAFRAELRRQAESVFQSPVTSRPIIDPDATDLMGLLNTNNYPKGSWVLHTLRGMIGDSAFQEGIRRWYAAWRDSTALSADLARIMGEVAGRDLEWYFSQALTQPGYPKLDVSWWHKGKRLELRVRQVQPEEWGLYRLPRLMLAIDGTRIPVDVEGRETTISLHMGKAPPREILVDPDGWWLLKAKVSGESRTGDQ